MAKVSLPAFGGGNPVAFGIGRVLADVLLVAALEFGNPIGLRVAVEADDFARDADGLWRWLQDPVRSESRVRWK